MKRVSVLVVFVLCATSMFAADVKSGIRAMADNFEAGLEQGRWALTVMPTGATTEVKDNGKYVIVWRKKAGKWWAVSDIYNSDNAPAM